jgi:hypothetical protein
MAGLDRRSARFSGRDERKESLPLSKIWNLIALVGILAAGPIFGCGGSGGGGNSSSGGGSGGGGTPAPLGEPEIFFPSWYNATPQQVISFSYNSAKTSEENGSLLKAAILALQPGQMLKIGAGTYSINSYFNIALQGTAVSPIWIVAKDGETPVITRPDANQNVINVGAGGTPTRFLGMRGLEITGGSQLLRLYDCANVWIDQCHLHHGGDGGLTANTADTDRIYLTRNEIDHPGGPSTTNEGMYLGANNGQYVMTNSVIALNHIHDTGGTQGDGIELKGGSYNNWIVANHVHDTNYPCIIVYAAGGKGINTIERNILYRSNDNAMQITGEAVVRNNLIMSGTAAGFASTDNQGATANLQVVHNTIINTGRGANLSSWNSRQGMVFANNGVYSRDAESIRFPNGSAGVTVKGNVVLGPVEGITAGYITGAGLADFASVAWDASARDATPTASSAIIGAGDPAYAVGTDITGAARQGSLEAGAYDRH